MKRQPFFNNPRALKSSYQGPPRNRAERRSMAKKQGKSSFKSRLAKAKEKASGLLGKLFKPKKLNTKAQTLKPKTLQETVEEQRFLEELTKREQRQADYYAKRKPAVALNEALDYASSLYGGNSEYTKYLIPLMRKLMGDDEYIPEAGDKTTYFNISKKYTGNPNELFKYVKFKTIPHDEGYVEKMLDLDWSSPENYYSHLADINAQKYSTNLKNTTFSAQMIDLLEHIMNTSAAWRIAQKNALDSEQVKSNWLTLFSTAQEAQNAGSDVMNKFVQMVMNEEDLGVIMQTVDTMIYKALKE